MTDQVSLEDLPAPISGFLGGYQNRDLENLFESFSSDAKVIDDGNTYRGPKDIRAWLTSSASEFTYTTTPVVAHMLGPDHYDVVQHLEGNFPGGEIDLHFRFTLSQKEIVELIIEP